MRASRDDTSEDDELRALPPPNRGFEVLAAILSCFPKWRLTSVLTDKPLGHSANIRAVVHYSEEDTRRAALGYAVALIASSNARHHISE